MSAEVTWILFMCAAASLSAIPLFVLIMEESEEIADTIRAFNNKCAGLGDSATEKQKSDCRNEHEAIAGALAKFVILAHEELDFLPEDPAKDRAEQQALHPDLQFDDRPESDKRTLLRRKDMQLHVRWAQYWISCLGRENTQECKTEKAALDKEDYPFGRIGLAAPYPTHEGKEEAKHWHAIKVKPEDIHPLPKATRP